MFKMRGKMIRLRRNTHLCQMLVELCHLRLLLADIDYELFKQLHQVFIMSKDIMELVNACDKILYRRMEKRIVSDALLLAATMISDSHGQVKVKEVAQQTCYSERHLNRLFLAQIGMNIKNYARFHACRNLRVGWLKISSRNASSSTSSNVPATRS